MSSGGYYGAPVGLGWDASPTPAAPPAATRWRADRGDQVDPVGLAWSHGRGQGAVHASLWANAQAVAIDGTAASWSASVVQQQPETAIAWRYGQTLGDSGTRCSWGSPIAECLPLVAIAWRVADRVVGELSTPWAARPPCLEVIPLPWGSRTYLRPPIDFPWSQPQPGTPEYPFPWQIEPPAAVVVPARGFYLVMHSAYLQRLSDGADIPASGLDITTDADSVTWDLRAPLAGQAAADLLTQPGQDLVEVDINGYRWEFIHEAKSPSLTFDQRSYQLSGRSRPAILTSPYERSTDGTSSSDNTTQQLAIDQLPLAGWTLAWTAPDWLIPTGAWSWQGLTPLQAIQRLAQAGGGILQSDRTGQALTVQPRYKVWPWQLDAATVDYQIPEAAILAIQYRDAAAGTANAVNVHGGELGGILGLVTLGGTAGDIELTTIVDDLITHVDAARGRGGQALADYYPAPIVESVTIPLSAAAGDFPLAQVGDVVEVTRAAGNVRGLCTGVAVSVQVIPNGLKSHLQATQTITLHGRSSNAWVRLQALSPTQPRQVGQVVALTSDRATVQLIGGGLVRARGSAALNDWVYIRGDQIEGQAPALTAVPITV